MTRNIKMPDIRLISFVLGCIIFSIEVGVEARKSAQIRCQEEECQLQPQHFVLYSNVKQAVESDFDLNGKDVISFIRSVDVLRKRFSSEDATAAQMSQLNGTTLIKSLLGNERLLEAMKVFQTDSGRSLIGLFGSSVNGRAKNLACSEWRIGELEWAARKLRENESLAAIFAKIHKNFAKKSGKKCLKHACHTIDENMSQIDSIIGRPTRRGSSSLSSTSSTVQPLSHDQLMELNKVDDDNSGTTTTNNNNSDETIELPISEFEREFAREELELCRFLKRTNETNCQVSGRLLSQIRLNASTIDEYLADYRPIVAANQTTSNSSDVSSTGKSAIILANCHAMRPLLTYNLQGLRWYTRHDVIEERKLSSRTFWCPSLSYWLEMDRLCGELEAALPRGAPETNPIGSNGTFAY